MPIKDLLMSDICQNIFRWLSNRDIFILVWIYDWLEDDCNNVLSERIRVNEIWHYIAYVYIKTR